MSENDDTWEESIACPVCGSSDIVFSAGPKDAEILIVAEFPGEDEIAKGKPLTGPTGVVLKQEMARVGIDIRSCLRTNLWQHAPNKNAKCLEHGMNEVIKLARGRKAILLVGSETVKVFTGKSVSKVTSLKVQSDYMSAPLIMAMVSPAIVFKEGGIGEVRLALERFANKFEALHNSGDDENVEA